MPAITPSSVLLTSLFWAQAFTAPTQNPRVLQTSIQHFSSDQTGPFIPLVQIGTGSPPQKVTCILDTGSSDLVIPQSKSELCNDPQQQCTGNAFVTGSFDPGASSDVSKVNTPLNTSFVNGVAFTGSYVKSTLTLGGNNASVSNVQMGLADQGNLPPNTPLFPIFGVGPIQGEGVQDPYPNGPAQMKASGAIKSNAFAVYMNDFRSPSGSITFGGIDQAKFQGQLAEAPLLKTNDGAIPSFVVDFSSLQLVRGNNSGMGSAKKVDLSPKNGLPVSLIDTGNPAIGIPSRSMQTLARALGTTFDQQNGALGSVPCSLGAEGASLAFGFNQDRAKINVPMDMMLIPDAQQPGQCFLPIDPADDMASLGAPFMQAAYIVFDMDQTRLMMAQAVINATDSRIQEFP